MTFEEDIRAINKRLNHIGDAAKKNEVDIGWLKRIAWWQLGIGASSFILLLGILAKILVL